MVRHVGYVVWSQAWRKVDVRMVMHCQAELEGGGGLGGNKLGEGGVWVLLVIYV